MAPQKDYLVEVVFTLPGEAQLIRISGKDRTPIASGLFSIVRFVPFPAPPNGAALYCAEVHTTRVYFSQTPGSCVHTSPRHYAFADNENWLGLSLPEGIGVKEIKHLEELLAEHAGLENVGAGRPPGSPSGGVRTGEVGEGQVVRIGPTGQLSFETLSAAASPYVKELQKQAIVLAAVAGPHVERAAPHVAQGIEKGSDVLAQAIIYGAEKCSSGLAAGGEFVSQKVAPAEKPAEVTEEDRLKAQRIRQVTGVAAKVSKGVADGVVAFATSVAGAVSGAVGSTETGKRVKESKSGLKDVAAASLGAFGKVYVALETGTKRVFQEAGVVTTGYVRHRHGHEAGALAAEYVEVAGNVAASGYALNQVGVRTVVETTAHVTVTDLTRQAPERVGRIEGPAQNGQARGDARNRLGN
ncbi:hypothetical protein KFL_003960110 [Klebsormidium nitens]|uniref:Senescence domain-containing protein n=1 Tax=Klebsormidium nitens TaxID=105231 RepID=A0A1Y1IAV7_KLENI|nr:hypothetical protein KFL_003960110 [Klebsormidium nitens]|eukprot:GAQ88050.1 hypothetical protein KFL_003960110 [Klebsormidium nitens]